MTCTQSAPVASASLTEATDGASLTYKLELITPDCEVFQVLPFKITYKK